MPLPSPHQEKGIDAIAKVLSSHFAGEPMSVTNTQQSLKSSTSEAAWPDDESTIDKDEEMRSGTCWDPGSGRRQSSASSSIEVIALKRQVEQLQMALRQQMAVKADDMDDSQTSALQYNATKGDGQGLTMPASTLANRRGKTSRPLLSISPSIISSSDTRSLITDTTHTVSTPATEVFEFGFDVAKEEPGTLKPRHTDVIVLDDEDMKLERGTYVDVSTRGLERLTQWRKNSAVDRVWRSDFATTSRPLSALYEDGRELARTSTAASRASGGSGDDKVEGLTRTSWSRKNNERIVSPAEGKAKMKRAAGRGRIVPVKSAEDAQAVSVSPRRDSASSNNASLVNRMIDRQGDGGRRPSIAASISSGSTKTPPSSFDLVRRDKVSSAGAKGKGRMIRGPGRGRMLYAAADGNTATPLPAIVRRPIPAIPLSAEDAAAVSQCPQSSSSLREADMTTTETSTADMPQPAPDSDLSRRMSSSQALPTTAPPPLHRSMTATSVSSLTSIASTLSQTVSTSPSTSTLPSSGSKKKALATFAKKAVTAKAPNSAKTPSAIDSHDDAAANASKKPAKMKAVGQGRVVVAPPSKKTSKGAL